MPIKASIATVSFGILVAASPVVASILPTNGAIDDVIEDVIGGEVQTYVEEAQAYWEEIQGYYEDIINGDLEDILAGIPTTPGSGGSSEPAMGIPDTQQNREEAISNADSPEAVVRAKNRADLSDRGLANAIAQTVIGEEGQEFLQAQQEAASVSLGQAEGGLEQVKTLSDQAQSKNITQNVMKDLVKQQAAQSAIELSQTTINRQMSQQLSDLKLQGAASNLMLSDVSAALAAAESRAQREERTQDLSLSVAGARIYIPGVDLTGE